METQRKPYYVLRPYASCSKLHECIGIEVYLCGDNAIQLYLTDEEVQKYNQEAVRQILRPYAQITSKHCLYIPAELILYAISEVLYESKEESKESNKG